MTPDGGNWSVLCSGSFIPPAQWRSGRVGEERNVMSVPGIEHWLRRHHPARRTIVTVTEIY